MENKIAILTDHDKVTLHSYFTIAEGTAEFWGENCEVVVHDLSRLDSSVVKIVNGHLSGRHTGAPISEVTLSFVNKMLATPTLRHVTYFAKNKRGDAFKASISAIEGEKGNIIGLFCINYYLTASLLSLLQNFTPSAKTENENISETFVENAEELMLNALEEAKKAVYDNLSISSSNKNKEIVSILYQKGIFNLKDSVITIANHLGISKNTVYMHIRNMNK
ncbi:MAG: PAS domain-containing protein [Bacillota bacterium]|nr:PAS domain-containing protein [Bacillota bacterium]